MNIQDKKDILSIITVIKNLKEKAELRSRTIINNDHNDDINRAKAEGYANAYDFCIILLNDFLYGKKMDYKNLRGVK